jgi:hypothetical protein
VDQDGSFGLAPGLAEPVLAVEEILRGRVVRWRFLRERPHRGGRTGYG